MKKLKVNQEMINEYLKHLVDGEKKRQEDNIELIASENYVSEAVMELQGSCLTNKYAEGYPGKKYYGGCEWIDDIENFAIEKACELFDAKFANVQPHSGSGANMAAYRVLLNHGDKILGMDLNNGGHLTHGNPHNFSGADYEVVAYTVDEKTERIDYDEVGKIALREKPKLIIAGASAYPRTIDFERFRIIADEVGAYLVVDMAHIAGLVATGLHPSPVPHAHITTTTTHKTLRGPRGGLILTNDLAIAKKIDKEIFPGIQGGPLMHVIAAKAQCFCEALEPSFRDYQIQVLKNAKALAQSLQNEGIRVVSGGTDNHLLLIDIKNTFGIVGKEAEKILDSILITTNKNTIPGETESPFRASGLRLGSPAMTTRGFKEEEFIEIGKIIADTLKVRNFEKVLKEQKEKVLALTAKFPIYK